MGRIRRPIVRVSRRARAAIGTVMSVLSGVAFFLGTPSEWGLAPNILVAGGVFLGTGLIVQVVRDQSRELAEKTKLLDEREMRRAGLKEFGDRIGEGNQLARQLGRWPKIVGAGDTMAERQQSVHAQAEERRNSYTQAAKGWNAACIDTVEKYLPGRGPVMERPVVRADPPRVADKVAFRLQEETTQKIDRMILLQKELSAQSSSAAISSQVQT